MSAGSGPERDDYSLPRVDVQIPDDARELEPDIQVYRRELRALRRKRRAERLRRPLGRREHRPGQRPLMFPILACSLMLALISSTLLVMFAARDAGVPAGPGQRPAEASRLPPAAAPSSGQVNAPLPPAVMILNGGTVPLGTITASGPAVLALVPPGCSCSPALRQLAAVSGPAHVHLYLVGRFGEMTQVSQLATQAGAQRGEVLTDMANVLAPAYSEHGLTALLVRTGGTVAGIVRNLPAPQSLQALRHQLGQLTAAGGGEQATASAGR